MVATYFMQLLQSAMLGDVPESAELQWQRIPSLETFLGLGRMSEIGHSHQFYLRISLNPRDKVVRLRWWNALQYLGNRMDLIPCKCNLLDSLSAAR